MWENLKFVLSNTDIIRLARSVLPLGASVWLYTPLCQTRAASCWLTLSICFFRVAYPWPSRASITSSTKPEVHNVSQRHQSRNEPRPLITRTHKTFVDWTWSFGDMLVDRQTDRQIRRSQNIAIRVPMYRHSGRRNCWSACCIINY